MTLGIFFVDWSRRVVYAEQVLLLFKNRRNTSEEERGSEIFCSVGMIESVISIVILHDSSSEVKPIINHSLPAFILQLP